MATSPSASRSADPAVRPSLRERKKARTREAVQQHALRLFRDQGYAETTVEQIADAAEISPSTFFRYFPTKADVVLSEFMDSHVFEMVIDAPADLDLIGALRHAMRRALADMTDEQVALEMERNQLIATVPELQRGLLEELARPIRLLAEAFALRLGTTPEDPGVVAYAGAAIGVMVALAGPLDAPEAYDFRDRIEPTMDLLEQTLVRRI